MVCITICGIDIDFPFEPYECQKYYMEKVIMCLQAGRHGVLESPTGTGKTLCLLCATLAWREAYMAKMQLERMGQLESSEFRENLGSALTAASGNVNSEGSWDRGFLDAPKIIYASRTHSQISQAVNELKNTRYKPKISVLGSREQMCINSEVMKEETNNGKVHLCRVKVTGKQCFYYNNLEANKNSLPSEILDIEDMVSIGIEKKFCPYYMAREAKKEADLIFMPYNYVLDFKARNAHSVDLNNTVILLDEAHNIERVCEENSSFDLTSFDLASCIEECQQCIEILLQYEEDGTKLDEGTVGDLTVEDTSLMKTLFLQLETFICEVELDKNDSTTKPAIFLFDMLAKMNVTSQSKDQILETLERMSGLLAGAKTKVFKSRSYALDKMTSVIKTLFSKSSNDSSVISKIASNSHYYKVHIHTEKKNDSKKQNKLDIWANKPSTSKEAARTLSYWCFNPGLTMQELLVQGVRSLILTSGTLSPLQSFKQGLQIKIDVELENSHVIERHQVFVGIISQGPDGKKLNSSYQFRSTPEYQVSLGNTLVNLSRIIPHGLLVFFPSYPVMDMIIAKWQTCGIWNRLNVNKGLYIEPRRKDGLNEAMKQFYENIQDPNMKGAVFFAVCRGKVSEGLDFANENGRAVVITGLPFPPSFDPRVVLKKQMLDEQKQKETITGKEWYRQQASRAVNQAIGRVIRHKNDFGAILLCDERFCYSDAKAHLPAWIKQQIKEYKDFGQAQKDLVIFFKEIQHTMGSVEPKNNAKRKLESLSSSTDLESYKAKQQKISQDLNSIPHSRPMEHNDLSSNIRKGYCSKTPQACAPSPQCLSMLNRNNEKKGSVFDSIKKNHTTLRNEGTSEAVSSSSSKKSVSTGVSLKNRKYKIIKSTSTELAGNSSLQKPKGDTIVKDAKQYLIKVKSILSKEKYEMFGEAMKLFKKSGNIQVLMNKFENVFDRANIEHVSLLEGFSFFVTKPEDKKYFESVCEGFSVIRCIYCTQEAFKAHSSPCQHYACYPCWTQSKKRGIITCPKCQFKFKKKQLKRSYMDGHNRLYGYNFSKLT